MSNDAAVYEYLDYYLDQPGDPDFAVMLEGSWGSGKSYFINRYFDLRMENADKTADAAKDAIRVTLFGVSDLDEITSQIFAKLHPYLSGKTAQVVNVIGSKIVQHFGVPANAKDNASIVKQLLLNLEGRVLVFDDFERCSLPVVELMGFINRFVEQDKLKVIVVASEKDILEKKDYDFRKEKLIGKTIRVSSDAGIVLDAFSSIIVSPSAKAAIDANREAVLTTLQAGMKPNYRSLRSVLSDFDRLVGLAEARLRSSPKALRDLLVYMIAVGMEYRAGHIDADGMRSLAADVAVRLNFSGQPETSEHERGRSLITTYTLVSWSDPIVPPEMLAELFSSGSFDLARLNDHLAAHPKVVGEARVPEWRAMWSWYDMSATQYRTVRDAFAQQLQRRAITEPGQILHAAGISLRLLKSGDNLLGLLTPLAFFTAYLSDLEASDALLANPDLFADHEGAYAGLIYNENETNAFQQIYRLVKSATLRALARRTKREAVDLLERLQMDPTDGSMLRVWGLDERNYGEIAILHNISVSDMTDLLLVDGKLNDQLLAALLARYDPTRPSESLDPEKKWVINLHSELVRRLKLVPAPYRTWNENRLSCYFERLLVWAKPRKPAARSVAKLSKAEMLATPRLST